MPRDDRDRRLDEEVRFHLEMKTERNIRLGMTPEEARRRAQIEFGAREHWKEEARDVFRRPLWRICARISGMPSALCVATSASPSP